MQQVPGASSIIRLQAIRQELSKIAPDEGFILFPMPLPVFQLHTLPAAHGRAA
jgi:hypothetical protein